MNTEDNSDKDSSSDEDDHDLAMLPPTEKTNAETDTDSDASDHLNDGPVHHLPRCLLNSTCDSSLLNSQIRNHENHLQETGKKTLTFSQL